MRLWTARLGKDGHTIRCGWTVGGRANCTDSLGTVEVVQRWGDPVRRRVVFGPSYKRISEDPTTLAFHRYAADKMRRGLIKGNLPRPRRAVSISPVREDGTRTRRYVGHTSDEWSLPAIAPCEHGHMNGLPTRCLRPRSHRDSINGVAGNSPGHVGRKSLDRLAARLARQGQQGEAWSRASMPESKMSRTDAGRLGARRALGRSPRVIRLAEVADPELKAAYLALHNSASRASPPPPTPRSGSSR